MRNLLIAGGAIFVAFFMVLNLGPGSGACPTGELGELTARNVERVASAAAAREVAKALAAVQAGVRAAGTAVQVAACVKPAVGCAFDATLSSEGGSPPHTAYYFPFYSSSFFLSDTATFEKFVNNAHVVFIAGMS
jgi:hypothetical protein